jgi:hypothetical protein
MTGRPPYHELETYDDRARWPPPYSRARRQTPEGRNFGDTIGLSHHISRQKNFGPQIVIPQFASPLPSSPLLRLAFASSSRQLGDLDDLHIADTRWQSKS